MATDQNEIVELWVRRAPGSPLLVLLHGFGQNENELVGATAGLQGYAVVALRGLAKLGSGESPFPRTPGSGAYTWVPKTEDFPLDLPTIDFPARAFAETVSRLSSWIRAQQETYPEVHLAGFSQGGIVAGEIVRSQPGLIRSLSLLSSFTASDARATDRQLAELELPIFFSHGTADEAIQQAAFARTSRWAGSHGVLTEKEYIGMYHQMTYAVANDFQDFLNALR